MNTKQPTYIARFAQPNPTWASDSNRLPEAFQSVLNFLSAIFQALFVIDAPLRSEHGGLIRGLFLAYLFTSFLIFGPMGLLVMPLYQIAFKQLLRAVF